MPSAVFGSQAINSFAAVYEPSGAVQLADGTLFLIEDEGDRPIVFSSLIPTKKGPKLSSVRTAGIDSTVEDLEGVARGKDNAIYLITSHAATKKGKHKKKREQLLGLNVQAQEITQLQSVGNLLLHIRQHLKTSLDLKRDELESINIEGLSFDPSREKLLIGLREPLHEGKSIILTLSNPYALVHGGQQPHFNELITLDIEGAGIRSLTYDPHLSRYLLAGEMENRKGKLRSRVWVWDGIIDHPPVRVRLPKMKGIKNIEGITPVYFNGAHYLLLVCDDGDRKKERGAHYVLIDTKELEL